MKKLNKTITAYAKQFKLNKEILKGSLRSSLISLMKILLLHKLQQMKYFKPFNIVFKIIGKWSLYTTLVSIIYSLICSIFHIKYDLTFIIGICSALWVMFTEFSLDYVFDIWDSILKYYNKILAKIQVRLSQKPETKNQSEKIKEMFAKVKPEDRLYNHDEVADYYIEQEKRKKYPNYTPDYNKYKTGGWFNSFGFRDLISLLPYLFGLVSFGITSYYLFEQIRSLYAHYEFVRDRVNEFNNLRQNINNMVPAFIRNWLWRRIWPFGGNNHIQLPGDVEPNNQGGWLNWLKNMLSFGRNNSEGNDNGNNNRNNNNNNGIKAFAPLAWFSYFTNPWRNKNDRGDTGSEIGSDYVEIEHGNEPEPEPRSKPSLESIDDDVKKLSFDDLKTKICFVTGQDLNISINDLYELLKNHETEYCSKGSETYQMIKLFIQMYETRSKSNTLFSSVFGIFRSTREAFAKGKGKGTQRNTDNNDNSLSDHSPAPSSPHSTSSEMSYYFPKNENENTVPQDPQTSQDPQVPQMPIEPQVPSGDTTPTPPTPRALSPMSFNEPTGEEIDLGDHDGNVWYILPIILGRTWQLYKSIPNIGRSLINNLKQIKNKTVKQITNIENKINSLLVTSAAPNAPSEGNYYLSKVYHINNYNNYDLPFKVLIKFFDSLALDEAWINYPNETIKNIAKDRCILLNIKLQSCDFYYKNEDIFNPFIPHDYNYVNNNPIFSINKNIPLDLTVDKFIYEVTFLNAAIINSIVRDIDISIFGSDIDIIFEYKFISEKDYQIKMNEIK